MTFESTKLPNPSSGAQSTVVDDATPIVDDGVKTVLFEVFGCQMNVVDAELVLGRLRKSNYVETRDYSRADLVVFNTCSVRGHAEDRVISRLGALRPWKREKPGRVLAVMGCMAQREAADIRRRMPHVDVITGTKDFPRLPELVARVRREGGAYIAIDGELRPDIERMPTSRPHPFQAYVTVMRGCNRPCTYCIVPTVRGREVSRPVDEVVAEVEELVADGVVEVCLLGQTVNAYDGGAKGAATLGTLLRRLDRVNGLRRLRFVTSHPRDFDDDTLDSFGECSKLDRFLHMPIQSGSDRVLRAMRRGYSVERYRRIVERIRSIVPDMQIGCDWIVGFPGETDEDFASSVAVCEEMRFVQSFVFKYSPRPGTYAANELVDDVPDAVKRERNQALLAAQERVSLAANRGLIGTETEVLIEGKSRIDDTRWAGRDPAHRIVVVRDERLSPGRFARVRIVDFTALTLFGDVIEPT
jgi:tRNA-2-methylthio-N6-dimethylallyladenosine synthase